MTTTGSAQRKGNLWYAVLAIPDTKTGKKRTKWERLDLPSKASKKAATKATNEIIAAYNGGSIQYSKNIPFADWVNQWLEHKSLYGTRKTTLEGYRTYANKRIVPYFSARGAILQKLTVSDIQTFYDSLVREGLSPSTVRRYHAVIRGSLKWALRQAIIATNPAESVELPPLSHESVAQALTASETNHLLECMKSHKLYPAVLLCVYYGLRREEVAGLEWGNVDLENRTILICKTMTRNRTLTIEEDTKTQRSRRVLHIPDSIAHMLRRLQTQQKLDRLEHGEKYHCDHDFVLRHEDGRMMTPDYISTTFSKQLEKHHLRHIRFHDLRHTAAMLMLGNGSDFLDVRDTLGHTKTSTTIDLYGQHVNREASRKTAATMGTVIKLQA